MEQMVDEIVKGRKTFFIAPDESLISEYFLEDYLYRDFECYFINNDIKLPLEKKVESILSLFQDSIVFFNIDSHINGIDWPEFISKMNRKYVGSRLGVIYTKRKTLQEKLDIERQYLFDIGIQGGCVQLEYQKKNNFGIIERALYANQAMGRRKTVRTVCPNNCFLHFFKDDGTSVTGKINDISLSHFSFVISKDEEEKYNFQVYEKFQNVTFVIKGLHFTSDAILFMKREIDDGILCVFAFVSDKEQIGLDELKKKSVVTKMYEIMHDNCSEVLGKQYEVINHEPEIKPRNLTSADFDVVGF